MGVAGCFSFFPSKNLGAFGDAGLITTNDPGLAHELRLLRNHGAEPKYFHKRIGANFRMDALQAAVLRVKLPHLPQWTAMRRENAARYDALIASSGLASQVSRPVIPSGCAHIFNQYVVRVPDRDRVRAFMAERGDRHRGVLPRAVPSAGVLRRSWLRAGRFPAGRSGGGQHARAADLR